MQYYAVTFIHTKLVGWTLFLYAHIRYLKKLLKEDYLQISGPGIGTPVRTAMLIFKTTDRQKLEELVANDPYSRHGLVASSTVNLWDVRYGSMEKPDYSDPEGTVYYRAAYKLGDSAGQEECEKERESYLEGLLKERKLRAAGEYADDPLAGLLILAVKDGAEARAILKEDPYVRKRKARYQVVRWNPKFGEFI